MYAGLYGISSDNKAIMAVLRALSWNIDDQVDLMTKDQIQNVGRFLLKLTDFVCLYTVMIQRPCSTSCCEYLVSYYRKPAGNIHRLLLVAVADGHNYLHHELS